MTTGHFKGLPFVVTSITKDVVAVPCIVLTLPLHDATTEELQLWEHLVADTVTLGTAVEPDDGDKYEDY